MRRLATTGGVAAVLALAACGGGGGGGGSSQSGSASSSGSAAGKPANITLWVGFTARELGVIKQAVAAFEAAHPNIKVKTVGGISDDKIIAAIRSGNAPDVVQSFSADNTGAFCSSGGWIDLKPYLDRAQIDAERVPEARPRLHAVQRQALRAADAGRRLRPLLQQGRCSRRPGSRRRRRRSPS